jgi:hypothetical protein
VDVDPRTNRRSTVSIANIFAELSRIPRTNPELSNTVFVADGTLHDLVLTFQYRLICTEGFCGSDCSQTTNCPSFPPLCVPACSAEVPCPDGGMCQVNNSTRYMNNLPIIGSQVLHVDQNSLPICLPMHNKL